MTNREIVQEQALKEIESYKRSGIGVSMGVGKTRIAIKHLQKNYNPFIKALVVIPKLSVKIAWTDELKKLNLEKLIEHLDFTTYLSLNKQNPNDYDIVYLDECHSLLETHKSFLDLYTGKILGLTGTPPVRQGTEKYKMVQQFCPIKYKFSVDEATDGKIINDYEIIVHQLELSQVPNLKKKKKVGGFWYTTEVKDYAYLCQRLAEANTPKQLQFASILRMKAMMEYTSKEAYVKSLLKNMSDKCIVFANTQDQSDRICKHSFHSNNPNSDQNLKLFSDNRINHLSCVLQLSEGVTIPNLKQGIIMHAYGNERKTAQRIGRLLRLNPNQKAICHILCFKNTIDEVWISKALNEFDSKKIKFYNPLSK